MLFRFVVGHSQARRAATDSILWCRTQRYPNNLLISCHWW